MPHKRGLFLPCIHRLGAISNFSLTMRGAIMNLSFVTLYRIAPVNISETFYIIPST